MRPKIDRTGDDVYAAVLAGDLLGDLDLDSLRVMNLLLQVEDRFDISIPVSVLPDVKTVKDLALQIENLVRER